MVPTAQFLSTELNDVGYTLAQILHMFPQMFVMLRASEGHPVTDLTKNKACCISIGQPFQESNSSP